VVKLTVTAVVMPGGGAGVSPRPPELAHFFCLLRHSTRAVLHSIHTPWEFNCISDLRWVIHRKYLCMYSSMYMYVVIYMSLDGPLSGSGEFTISLPMPIQMLLDGPTPPAA
jgi:hypothetical protein